MKDNLFESLFNYIREDDFSAQQNKTQPPQDEGDAALMGPSKKDDEVDSTGQEQDSEEKTEEENEIEDKKEYLGQRVDDHFYLVTENGDIVIQDAAGTVVMTAKDKMGADFKSGSEESKREFIKLAVGELKLNVSYDTLEQNGWFDAKPNDELAIDQEQPTMTPPTGSPAAPLAPPAPPVPDKPDYKPITKEGGASAIDQVLPLSGDGKEEITVAPGDPKNSPVPAEPIKQAIPVDQGKKMKTPNPKYRNPRNNESKLSKMSIKELLELKEKLRK